MHPLDLSLQLEPSGAPAIDNGAFRARTSDRYRNAIGPYGGWTAALLLKSVLAMRAARGAPLALDATFMGAIDEDELEVRVACLRQNRSVGFWRSELWQHGRIVAQAQITLSTARTGIDLQDALVPDAPRPDAVPVYVNPREPVRWVEQYVFKPVRGLLFSRAESMDSTVWLRDAEPRILDAVSLTALCDAPFPSPWIRLDDQVPVSTVAFSVYFRGSDADMQAAGSDFVLIDTHAALARNGYFDQFTTVWSASGRLLAQTQQILWMASTAPERRPEPLAR